MAAFLCFFPEGTQFTSTYFSPLATTSHMASLNYNRARKCNFLYVLRREEKQLLVLQKKFLLRTLQSPALC